MQTHINTMMQQPQRKRRAVSSLYGDDVLADTGLQQAPFWSGVPEELADSEYMLSDDLDVLLESFDYEGAVEGFDIGYRPDDPAFKVEPPPTEQPDDAHSRELSGSGPTETLQSAESGYDVGASGGYQELRCIDDTHPHGCTRCLAAPAAELEGAYELVGDPGKKNGEKRLRHLLTRTPEWKSGEERERLADLCSRDPALGPLAAALHAKSCSALRKGHLLFMVRAWGYKSDLWVPRGSRGKAAPPVLAVQQQPPPQQQYQAVAVGAAAGPVQRQPQQVMVQRPSTSSQAVSTSDVFKSATNVSTMVETEKLSQYVNSRLKPLALEAARCNVGSAASEAAWLHGGQHITEAAANEVHKVMQLTRSFTDQWRLHKQCIQGRLDSLADSPEEANTPAYLTCMGKESPTERLIFEILSYVQQAATFNSSVPKQLGDAITAAESAWVNEVAKGQKVAMELLARILAIVAEARLASLQICLSAFVQLLEVLAMWTTASSASFAQREAWMRSYISVHGNGAGSAGGVAIFKVPEVREQLTTLAAAGCQPQQACPQMLLAVEAEVRKLAAH